MNYYCLVAGLPDIQLDDSKGFASAQELKSDLLSQLSPDDARLLRLIYAEYDNANFISFLKSRDAKLNSLGNLTTDDWEQLVRLMQESEHPQDERLLPYFVTYYHLNQDEEILAKGITREDYLSGLYYEYATHTANKFLNQWFEFNLNLKNLFTAIACRKYNYDQQKLIIGHNEIARILRHTHSRDYGISGIFDSLELVLRIAEESDLLEREKKVDALRWSWLEEQTFFHYFSIERIIAYVLKVQMLERWKLLSVESGAAVFREMLSNLKEGVELKDY